MLLQLYELIGCTMLTTTVVAVMLAWNGKYFIPTLEFPTQAKCEAALLQMEKQVNEGEGMFKTTRLSLKCITVNK